jgi:GAF domain-containing protein
VGSRKNSDQRSKPGWAAEVRKWTLRHALPVVLPAGTLAATAAASVNQGLAKFYWYLLAGSTVIIAGLVNLIKDRRTRTIRNEAIRAKTALGMTFSGVGQPLIAALGSATAASKVEDVRAAVKVLLNRTVAVAQAECGRQTDLDCRTRAVFYRFVGPNLELAYCEGRHGDTPRESFLLNGSPHEQEAIRVARGQNAVVVNDLENSPPPHFTDSKGRSYKAFIAVPVRAGGQSFGLFIADSDKAFSFSDVDKGYLVVLAGILAAGLAHLENAERAEENRNQSELDLSVEVRANGRAGEQHIFPQRDKSPSPRTAIEPD